MSIRTKKNVQRTKKPKSILHGIMDSLRKMQFSTRTKIPAVFKRICIGTILTKKDVEDIVVLQDTVFGVDHKTLKVKAMKTKRIANCHIEDLYVKGYFPSRQMEREKVLEMLGMKREPIIRCTGSRKNIITCKIIKGKNPRKMHVDNIHMKGRTVVGVKVRCSVCGKRCGVIYSRGEYLIKKHKAQKPTEEVISKRTKQTTSKRTK